MSEVLRCVRKNQAFVQVDCSDSVAAELRDRFTFQVPGYKFTPAYKARLWDGNIRLFNSGTRALPGGLFKHLEEFAFQNHYRLEADSSFYESPFSVVEAASYVDGLALNHIPRDYQLDAFRTAVQRSRVLLLSPTASGKSLILYMIIRWLLDNTEKKGLLIVPRTNLVEQMFGDFKDYSERNGWSVEENCHRLYGGKEKTFQARLVITTWQSIYEMPKNFFAGFGFVLGDEAHNFKAKSLSYILGSLVNADYRIGTTGTLDGSKTHQLVLEGHFGPVKRVTTTKELIDAGHVANVSIDCLVLKYSDATRKVAKHFDYPQEVSFLVEHEKRNRFIANLALSLKGNTIVFYEYVDRHGRVLCDLIRDKGEGRTVHFVHGGVGVPERESVRQQVMAGSDHIMVASRVFQEGMNITNLDNLIFASPSKSRIKILQSIGRTLRGENSKIFDISDDLIWKSNENYTIKHFGSRVQYYVEEKLPFKIYNIQLEKDQ